MTAVGRLDSAAKAFPAQLDELLGRGAQARLATAGFEARVVEIIEAVRHQGDAAVLDLTRRLDRFDVTAMAELTLDQGDLYAALEQVDAAERAALTCAVERIRAYHQRQGWDAFEFEDQFGNRLGQQVTALQRVGFYVPGGQASYPSSVLMSVVPAQVAGVDEIIMVTPTPDGRRNRLVMAAAALAGVDRVFCIGGAQAVAALAFGTASVPAVDKVVGPGGAWVAAAKRLLYGTVGIDVIAGPSEIVVIADASADVERVVMDLFSQAEHDAASQALLLSPDGDLLDAVAATMERLLPEMARAATIGASLRDRGALIRTGSVREAVDIANRIAPEHLELCVRDPDQWLSRVRHAGAIFVGSATAESLGDYVAGPSHVLPTAGTARFSSPLSVYDFQKRTSVIRCSPRGASELATHAAVLARSEGLEAHARAAELRISGLGDPSHDLPAQAEK